LDERLLAGSQVRSLLLDDERQKLILETALSDSEVDESALGLDLRRIMRVRQLGLQEELEGRRETQLLVTHLDVLRLTLLGDLLGVDRLDDGINRVEHGLDEDRVTSLDSELNGLDHLRVAQSSDLEALRLIGLSDPGDTLKLGIDHKSGSLGVREDGTILGGHSVWRKTVVVPSGGSSIVSEHGKRVRVSTLRNTIGIEEGNEVIVDNLISELLVEGTDV